MSAYPLFLLHLNLGAWQQASTYSPWIFLRGISFLSRHLNLASIFTFSADKYVILTWGFTLYTDIRFPQ